MLSAEWAVADWLRMAWQWKTTDMLIFILESLSPLEFELCSNDVLKYLNSVILLSEDLTAVQRYAPLRQVWRSASWRKKKPQLYAGNYPHVGLAFVVLTSVCSSERNRWDIFIKVTNKELQFKFEGKFIFLRKIRAHCVR